MTDAAFEAAMAQYGGTVFRLAYSDLKSRAAAEDVMRETLLKLYAQPPLRRRSTSGTGWCGWR